MSSDLCTISVCALRCWHVHSHSCLLSLWGGWWGVHVVELSVHVHVDPCTNIYSSSWLYVRIYLSGGVKLDLVLFVCVCHVCIQYVCLLCVLPLASIFAFCLMCVAASGRSCVTSLGELHWWLSVCVSVCLPLVSHPFMPNVSHTHPSSFRVFFFFHFWLGLCDFFFLLLTSVLCVLFVVYYTMWMSIEKEWCIWARSHVQQRW